MQQQVWHSLIADEVVRSLSTDSEKGLTKEEAALRLASGRNRLPKVKGESLYSRILRQFSSPIAVVLLLAALATTLLSHYTDAIVISVALLVNVIIGLIQEGRASRAFEALKKSEAKQAVVIRDGEPAKIPAEELVAGDLVVLIAGTAVPADIRLVEAHALTVNESALSGEWLPIEKDTEARDENAPLVERTGMVYSSTLIVSGAGQGVVVAVGSATEFGVIAKELGAVQTVVTPLMRDIRQIARFIVMISATIMLFTVLLGLLRGISFEETLLTAIALAVASVPEGLPAAVTVVLALGMERILKSGGLVRNLLAAETLGTTSVILTDKTGTLTLGQMNIHSYITYSGVSTDNADAEARALLSAAVLASDAYVEERADAKEGEERLVAHGRPIEQAVILEGLKIGIAGPELRGSCPRTDELHFDSARRFGGMLVREQGESIAYLSGAPELFLSKVKFVRDGKGVEHTMTDEMASRFALGLNEAARDGKRVIALMRVKTASDRFPQENQDAMLAQGCLIGLLVFSDQIRPEIYDAIRDMHGAGARVLMLTGDNPETALAIAKEVGIAGPNDRAYTGAELEVMSDEELLKVLRKNHVFARVVPSQKLRMANVLVGSGEVVAMTGDGVNDAPALSAASIGVAVGSGTDVAKEASDLVLLSNGFGVITAAIREGRRLRDNFKKIFAYMLSTNFSEVVLITFALIFALPLPILPTQILWANLIQGGLMNFAFAFEPLYPSAMKRKPKDPDVAQVLSSKLIKLIALVGTVTASVLILIYLALYSMRFPLIEIQTMMFIGVSMNTIFIAFSIKSFGTPLWRLSLLSNKFLLVALLASLAMLIAALYIPALQMLIHTVPPSPLYIAILLGFGIVNMLTIELAKWLFFIRPEEEEMHRRGLVTA
ncbi:HAD-IC family P-type ATPase [Patescibacteria group bacterium]|nr:HAD-IC family P-type ATPase [Patescibacteria group bacterium]